MTTEVTTKRWRSRVLGVASAVMMLAVTAVAPATAGDDAGDMPNRIAAGERHLSHNWAGYAVQSDLDRPADGVVKQVSGQWKVPAVTCTAEDSWSSVWVGIDGYDNDAVQQAGTVQACEGGKAKYYAFYQTYPNPLVMLPIIIRPGDVVSAEVQYTGLLNVYLLTLTNRTLTLNLALPITLPEVARKIATRRSAEWVVEAPNTSDGRILPLANFGTVTFDRASATIGRRSGDIASSAWEQTPVHLVNGKGERLASAGRLNADGDGFSVSWEQSK